MKTLIVGLGNPILTDDGIGIYVVRELAQCSLPEHVTVTEASVGGIRLLEIIAGYDQVILVDAIQTPDSRPGDVYRLTAGDLRATLHSGSSHDLSLPGALNWGRSIGIKLPDAAAISIIAVEAQDVLTFGEQCTSAVAAAIPRAVEMVLAELDRSPTKAPSRTGETR